MLLGLVLGLVLGAVAMLLVRSRGRAAASTAPAPADDADGAAAHPSSVDVIQALPVAVAVLDSADDVVLANRSAAELGVVRGPLLMVAELRRLVRETRRSGLARVAEVEPTALRLARGPEAVRVRLAPVGSDGHVALLVEDVTEARRVEAVRRDFVANVSHELKTPVGAMSLLAEALVDAADDPTAVRRFGGRLQREADRLATLVREIVDLSRLQGADPLPEQDVVRVDRVVAEAVDRTRTIASAAGIELVRGGDRGLTGRGSESQLITALTNLLSNAVHYSPERTRVAVGVGLREGVVEISVSDQGIGIADKDLDRVFERFYRADPARSRATGGTGLGLAIVKHIATNHGGEVTVWSAEGAGSTFTLRLPGARLAAPPSSRPVEQEETV